MYGSMAHYMYVVFSVLTHAATAYFVFGENVSVYDETDLTAKEFISAGADYVQAFMSFYQIVVNFT